MEGLAVIKVGDTLYQLHSWRRSGEPKWSPVLVVGETKQSWLYAPFGESHPERTKINKKTMMTARDFRGQCERYFTKAQREARDFCDQWARDIGSAVSSCPDPEKLKQIAAIVGKELA